jgi:hypothetical protein
MKTLSDQVAARRMLQIRDEGGYRLGTFLRLNARKYAIQGLVFGLSLALLLIIEMRVAFSILLGVILGSLARDFGWVRASRRTWPFTMRVINWEIVERLATHEEPPAPSSE